ncbi:opioid growth factor receptor (ogfr) region protein [Diplonema papillatum]|nr:opioid growth factor receptor (ogfr) region protein [Diplonema papillatum]
MGIRASAESDTQTYRDGYPGKADDPSADANLRFYKGEIKTQPGRLDIFTFHRPADEGGKLGAYDWLEYDHSYIQWLFPIREPGLNPSAQELQKFEAEAISADPVLQGRFVQSYELMLDFYGMRLVDPATGTVGRSHAFIPRYANLHQSFHNNLRITRILKALGEVGMERYKKPFVEHVLREIFEQGHLTGCLESCINYWVPTLRSDDERTQIQQLGEQLHEDNEGKVEPYQYPRAYGW